MENEIKEVNLTEGRDQNSPSSLVEQMAKIDPAGYADPRLSDNLKRVAAVMQRNLIEAVKSGQFVAKFNDDARELFRKNGMLFDQKAKALGFAETTTTSDIASVATQILPIITRAFATNPIMQLVDVIPMTGPQANIVYLDVKYGSTGGHYSHGSRVDLNDDPTYSDRTDCTASARELNAQVQKELTTATEKALGAKICLSAAEDAVNQFGLNLEAKMAEFIQKVMFREWSRNVADAIRTMAGNTTSWSATAPAPYSSLNTNEWRKVLAETLITLDAAIREDVYEPSEWLLTTPTSGAILERLQRVWAPAPGMPAAGEVSLSSGEFGQFFGRWQYFQDPYFANDTFLLGRKTFNLVPNSPFYFLPYQFMANVAMLFYPLTQIMELGAHTRAAMKMIEPNAYGRLDVTV